MDERAESSNSVASSQCPNHQKQKAKKKRAKAKTPAPAPAQNAGLPTAQDRVRYQQRVMPSYRLLRSQDSLIQTQTRYWCSTAILRARQPVALVSTNESTPPPPPTTTTSGDPSS
ncbi:hypothetical protein BP5796_09421 [Coleophoma crateriformis]|uniref:Uncharacterized protein n=1 Tax=Coleophoma crateriformis TaxID=565419 RepID=A0A3D8QXZ5_9HELO|nr:hypothetical protein BP5796_09421 [Coleophoma crateriformis]